MRLRGALAGISARGALTGRSLNLEGNERLLMGIDGRTAFRAAALGAVATILIGIALSALLNIWIDEAFTMHSTGAGPLRALAGATDFEAQPPLYFVLEAAWRELNELSIPFARLPSAVFAGLAVAVIVGAAHRIMPRVPPTLVALVTALNPLVIWAASEMRVYALVLFVGATLTWCFFEGFLVARPSRRAQLCYAVCALVGLYTQYYVGFVLVAHFSALLAVRRTQMRAFVVWMILVAVAFTPAVAVALRHVATSGAFVTRVTAPHAAHEILDAVFVFVLPHDPEWSGLVKLGGFAVAGALLIGLAVFGRPVLDAEPSRGVVIAWLMSLVLFALLFAVSGAPLDPVRHLIVIAPSSLLVVYLFVASLTRGRSRGASIAGAVFVVFALTTLWSQYRPPLAKRGDWQRVAQLLSAEDSAAPIAVFPAELALALERYSPRPTIPIPRPMPFTVDYAGLTTIASEADVARVLDPVRARAPRLWMVTSGPCTKADIVYYKYNCSSLEAYLARAYRVTKTVAFRGSLARLYIRTSNASTASVGGPNAN